MRTSKSIVLALAAAIVTTLAVAATATAGTVTSVSTTITRSAEDPRSVSFETTFEATDEPQDIYRTAFFQVSAWDETCSAAGYPYGTSTANFTQSLGGRVPGQPYSDGMTFAAVPGAVCVGVWASDDEEGTVWRVDAHPFTYEKPAASVADVTHTDSSITMTGAVDANGLTTMYWMTYFKKVTTSDCADPSIDDLAGLQQTDPQSLETNLNSPANVSVAATGLDVGSYCVQLHAFSDAGEVATDAQTVSTGTPPDTTAPSVPAGLTKNDVTQGAANISWGASSDEVGVTGYEIYKDGQFLSSTTGTSASVALACGTSASFTVAASDAAGNTSAQSAPLLVSGATCPAPAPPAAPKILSIPKTVKPGKAVKIKVSCPDGCTIELTYRKGETKHGKMSTISVKPGTQTVTVNQRFPQRSPAQLTKEIKKKQGKSKVEKSRYRMDFVVRSGDAKIKKRVTISVLKPPR